MRFVPLLRLVSLSALSCALNNADVFWQDVAKWLLALSQCVSSLEPSATKDLVLILLVGFPSSTLLGCVI